MTFGEVQEKVKSYLNRSDLDNQIPLWIQIAQRKIEEGEFLDEINKEVYGGYDYMKERKRTLTVGTDAYITLASQNYKETIWLKVRDGTKFYPMTKRSADYCLRSYPDLVNDVGRPLIFSYLPSQKELLIRPTPDKMYHFDHYYYKYSLTLNNSEDTNWLTDNKPECLIYGALIEAEPFLVNDARIQLWASLLKNSLASLQWSEIRKEYEGSPKRMLSSGMVV